MQSDAPASRQFPSLTAVRAFEAAARAGSFTLAARELFVTQSAVSRHVRNLEDRIGVPLFQRNGKRLTLTPDGREYMAATGEALDRITDATAALRAKQSKRALTVSMPPSLAERWFIPRLSDFMRHNPTVELRIDSSSRIVDLNREGIDVAIRYGQGNWPGVDAEPLCREEVFPVCSPGVASTLMRIDDLQRTVLLHGEIREDWWMWLKAAGHGQIDARRGPKFTEASSLIRAALDGLGVALGRTLLVAHDLSAGRLVAPFETRLPACCGYWLITSRHAPGNLPYPQFRSWLLDQISATLRSTRQPLPGRSVVMANGAHSVV